MLPTHSRYYEKGQAMLFGLLFLGVSVMALLILFNQGQLVKHRVQLENAADAAVYSQAKLAARNQNFIAYTNRAMVANEVSIGQMVALLSWAKHYKNVSQFISFPLYNIPIVPPSPVTYGNVLTAITAPYKILGTAVAVPTDVMVDYWPTVVSYFNTAVGVFQKVFALSTLEAQVEINLDIVEDHEADPSKPEMYTPVIGWFFFTQNALLTYFGENFQSSKLQTLLDNSDEIFDTDSSDLVADYLGGQQAGDLENMINDNSPGVSGKKSKNTSSGKDSNLNADEDGDAAIEAYKRYAAIVNRNREDFTKDRHWDFGVTTPDLIPALSFDLGILKIELDLDLSFWTGVKNDGGAAYIASSDLETDADIEKLGWAAIDIMSFGIEFYFNILFKVEVCIFGCSTIVDLDFGGTIPIGLPLAGATHQVVSDKLNTRKLMTDWGMFGDVDSGKWGGDEDDSFNEGVFDWFHMAALGWGQVSPTSGGGIYGVNPADVTDSYGAPPSYYSLGEHFQERGRSYEYIIALTKSMADVQTSDNDNIGIAGDADVWDDGGGSVSHTNFDVQSNSRAEANDFAGGYQRVIWNDERPMMTVSSAETYFSNPMQSNDDGTPETASLFSPFWDARLREPSAIALLIATGEIDWEDIFEGLSGGAIGLIEWLLNAVGDRVVGSAVDYALDQMESPFDDLLEDPITDAATEVKDVAVGAVVSELEDYLP